MKNNKIQNQILHWMKFIPIFMFIVISPLIVRYKEIEYGALDKFYWTIPHNIVHDVFNYNKSQFIIISGVAAFLFLIFWYILKGFKWSKIYGFILALLVCVLLSSFFSEHQEFVWSGYPEKMQGAWVWITYLIMIVYISQIVQSAEDRLCLFRIVMVSACIISGIGLFQTFGLDFFRSELGAKYLLGSEMYQNLVKQGMEMKFQFSEGQAYSFLYNPNYVGSYVSVLFPLCFGGFNIEKNKVLKIIWCAIGASSLIMLIGSKSRGGLVSITISMVIYSLLVLRQGELDKKKVIRGISIGAICLAGVLMIFGQTIHERITSMLEIKNDKAIINSIDTYSDRVEFGLASNQKIIVKVVNESGNPNIKITDEYGNDLKLSHNAEENYDQILGFDENVFIQVSKISGLDGFGIVIGESAWQFVYQQNEIRFITPTSKLGTIETTHTGWDRLETLGSNRWYIWTRALPITKSTIVLGKGPDTFVLEFPQNDYLKKEKLYGIRGIIVDKAHNGYIGMAMELGWICVLIFIAFHCILFKGIYKNAEQIYLLSALSGGVIVKVFNDFNIHTMFMHVVVVAVAVASDVRARCQN